MAQRRLDPSDDRIYKVSYDVQYADPTTDVCELVAAYFSVDESGALVRFRDHTHTTVFAVSTAKLVSIELVGAAPVADDGHVTDAVART